MFAMFSAGCNWNSSFWRLQAVAWSLTYALLLLAALPRINERDIFRYNTVGCAIVFCFCLGVRPLCRAINTRWMHSWLAVRASGLALSLLLGIVASFAIGLGTFGWARLDASNWLLSWLQCGGLIFLWCNLYISMENRGAQGGDPSAVRPMQAETHEFATQFAIRTGSRIQVVYEKDLLWVSAARDYSELHTASGAFLLRETMHSLQQRLDPGRFVRIHRSRMVRWDQISELTKLDHGEYRVKLLDGSVHRSSRTFAPRLETWLQ
jgi:hypothetical protein